jgi:hypothetical protein
MSAESKNAMRLRFAEQAMELAELMVETPPPLFLVDPDTGKREDAGLCQLSGEAGRVAVLSMTICNPLALKAAGTIEGAIS